MTSAVVRDETRRLHVTLLLAVAAARREGAVVATRVVCGAGGRQLGPARSV